MAEDSSKHANPPEGQPDAIEEAMKAAYVGGDQSRPPSESVLSALRLHTGVGSRITLRDMADPGAPIVKNVEDMEHAGRYQVLGEIARGGMGVVLKARDPDLGRNVALKVLSNRHRHRPDIVQRFVEEAQIGGQLQHPGIVPIYEMGLQAGDRPYFTMRLLQGKTLAALLEARKDPAQDRTRYLGIVHQVCQTMAYAHARGVIHRDLKPSNIMVGSFGEVQVIDWGLSKVMAQGGTSDDRNAGRRSRDPEEQMRTVRAEGDGSASTAGSVLGTPAYMPPEQARGRVDSLDERSDVFSLGAILCEILTGMPPYVGSSGETIRRKAEHADLKRALHRLETSDAEDELVDIAWRCLSVDKKERPRNAGVLAEEVGSFLESAEARVRDAELAAAEAEGRARHEGQRRRLTLALAATILVSILGAGGIWWAWEASNRAALEEAESTFRASLNDARSAYTTAMTSGAIEDWKEAESRIQLVAMRDTADLRPALQHELQSLESAQK